MRQKRSRQEKSKALAVRSDAGNVKKELDAILRQESIAAKDKFLAWILTPQAQRSPKTQRELAAILDVAEATLSRWKDEPEFCDCILDGARRRALTHLAGVIQSVTKRALGGSLYAAELFFKYICRWAEPDAGSSVEVNVAPVVHVSFGDEHIRPWFAKETEETESD
jgi:hypothetical protein